MEVRMKELTAKERFIDLINECQLNGSRLEVEMGGFGRFKRIKLIYNNDELIALKEAIIVCHDENLRSKHFKIYGFRKVN
jgi:hypothetical protein